MIFFRKIILLNLLFMMSWSWSQTITEDQRVWFAYTGQYKVSSKLGYHVEAQFRLDSDLGQSKQNLFRLGLIYYQAKNKQWTLGYALVKTHQTSLDSFFNENRLWQQFQYANFWSESKNQMIHRFRLEQRWVERLASQATEVVSLGSDFQSRLRYLNRTLISISSLKSEEQQLYAIFQNELFLTSGNNKINSKMIDQNRFLVGLGILYHNSIRIEAGYLNHFITSSTSNDIMNHTVSISLFHNLDFSH